MKNTLVDGHMLWDELYPRLASIFIPWHGRPVTDLRTSTANVFLVRAMRRVLAMDHLFEDALYLESYPVVRVAYEDWLNIAYVMRLPGDARCVEMQEAACKRDARLQEAFGALCGEACVAEAFTPATPEMAKYLGQPAGRKLTTRVAVMAEDVGLRRVHDVVYSMLSARTHFDARMNHIAEPGPDGRVEIVPPERDERREMLQAVWFSWFTARIAAIGLREFGIEFEVASDFLTDMMRDEDRLNLMSCALVREAQP